MFSQLHLNISPPQSLLITKYIPSIAKTVQFSVTQEEFIVPTSNTYALLCQIDTTTLIDTIPWLYFTWIAAQ